MSIRSRLKIVDLHGEEGEDARMGHFRFNLLFAFAASLISMKLFMSYANSCFELVASLKNRALKLVCAPALLGILDETNTFMQNLATRRRTGFSRGEVFFYIVHDHS